MSNEKWICPIDHVKVEYYAVCPICGMNYDDVIEIERQGRLADEMYHDEVLSKKNKKNK